MGFASQYYSIALVSLNPSALLADVAWFSYLFYLVLHFTDLQFLTSFCTLCNAAKKWKHILLWIFMYMYAFTEYSDHVKSKLISIPRLSYFAKRSIYWITASIISSCRKPVSNYKQKRNTLLTYVQALCIYIYIIYAPLAKETKGVSAHCQNEVGAHWNRKATESSFGINRDFLSSSPSPIFYSPVYPSVATTSPFFTHFELEVAILARRKLRHLSQLLSIARFLGTNRFPGKIKGWFRVCI